MICIPVTATTNEEARGEIERHRTAADCIELRLDCIESPDLGMLFAAKGCPLLVTNRKKDEGGFFSGTEDERVALLAEAARRGADYIDIELSTDGTLIAELRETMRRQGYRARFILSHHDFEQTPPGDVLRKTIDDAVEYGADMVKLATFAREIEDNLRVLETISYGRKQGVDMIALCMGDKGRISRVMAPFFGSFLCFAAGDAGKESAPGQLTVDEMKLLFSLLKP